MSQRNDQPRPAPGERSEADPAPSGRGPLRSEHRRILAVLVGALALAVAHVVATRALEGEASAARPSLVQYTLLSGYVLLVFALAFYLLRYLIRLLSERRAGILGSRFKFKLVATFIGLCILPGVVLYWFAILAISSAVDRALAPETEGLVLDAQAVARQFYDDAQAGLAQEVNGAAVRLAGEDGALPAREAVMALLGGELAGRRLGSFRLYFRGSDTPLDVPGAVGPRSPFDPSDPVEAAEDEAALAGARAGRAFVRQRWVDGTLHLVAGAPVPLRGGDAEPAAVLVAARRVPADLTLRVTRLREAAGEHARSRQQVPWIKREQQLLFAGFSLVIILAATWVSLYVARSITVPIQRLAVGTEQLRSGNLSHVVEWEGTDELASLVGYFNDMARDLRAKTSELERQASELREANAALGLANDDARQRRDNMEMLLQAMTAGVIALDSTGVVTTFNHAARQILHLPQSSGSGQAVEEFLSPPPLADLRREVRGFLGRDEARESRDMVVSLAAGQVHLQVVLTSRPDPGGASPGALAVFEDVTELVRAQKLATWEAVARRIAHEIKNPLTPIQLSAQRILKKHREQAPDFPSVLEAGIETIIAEVTGLKQMVDEFSRFARMPQVRLADIDVNIVLRSVAALYAGHEGLSVELDLTSSLGSVRLDAELVRRAVVNLVDNAVEAMGGQGRIVLRSASPAGTRSLRLEVADEGPGVHPSDREKLFLPYYTTKARGTGLGLAIVHRVAADHHGRVLVEDNAPRGARFILELPLPPTAGRPGAALESA